MYPFCKTKYFSLLSDMRGHVTHPACRIPHTPSHSTVGSAPKPDTDYRRLHTSEQSDGTDEIHT